MAAATPKPRAFVSLDIEADGPSPATNSCLMLGFAVARDDGLAPVRGDRSWVLETKEWCLAPQPGKVEDARCMAEFWAANAENAAVLADIRARAQPAADIMREFVAWYRHLRRTYTLTAWVAKPASYDAQWLNALFYAHAPRDAPGWAELPFSWRCISTLWHVAEKALALPLGDVTDPSLPHTHRAVDDALGQAFVYKALTAAIAGAGARLATVAPGPGAAVGAVGASEGGEKGGEGKP